MDELDMAAHDDDPTVAAEQLVAIESHQRSGAGRAAPAGAPVQVKAYHTAGGQTRSGHSRQRPR